MPEENESLTPAPGPAWQDHLKTCSEAATLLAKLTTGLGIVFVCSYFFRIGHLPRGLAVGDALFFIFAALSFVFITAVTLGYGVFSMVCVNALLTQLVWWAGGKDRPHAVGPQRKLLQAKALEARSAAGPAGTPLRRMARVKKWIRGFRRGARWGRQRKLSLVPSVLQGKPFAGMSFLALLTFSLIFWFFGKPQTYKLFWAVALASYMLLMFFALSEQGARVGRREPKLTPLQFRMMGVGLSAVTLFTFGGWEPLSNFAFERMGIRKENVLVEVAAGELGALKRIEADAGVPVLSCLTSREGWVLAHHVDVLWDQMGTQSLLGFKATRSSEQGAGLSESVSAILPVKADELRVLRGGHGAFQCYPVLKAQLFAAAAPSLSSEGQQALERLAARLEGAARRVELHGLAPAEPVRPQEGVAHRAAPTLPAQQAAAAARLLAKLLGVPVVPVLHPATELAAGNEPTVPLTPTTLQVRVYRH